MAIKVSAWRQEDLEADLTNLHTRYLFPASCRNGISQRSECLLPTVVHTLLHGRLASCHRRLLTDLNVSPFIKTSQDGQFKSSRESFVRAVHGIQIAHVPANGNHAVDWLGQHTAGVSQIASGRTPRQLWGQAFSTQLQASASAHYPNMYA